MADTSLRGQRSSHDGRASRRGVVRQVLDGLYLGAGWLAALFIFAIFALMMGLSLGRVVGLDIPAGDDFASWSMAAASFLGIAHTFRSGEIIRVGLLVDRLTGRVRRVAELGCLILGTLIASYFAWYATEMTIFSWRFNDLAQGVVALPLWIPQLGFCGGLILFAIALLDETIHVARGGIPHYDKPPPATAEEAIERAIQSGA
ncbi:TRAP transporter small permease [Tianweitania sp.]|uniref:TRAP transporter small permease n=1 Tax=Tianweitania sp. TaxID=2021634 RepID=UPI00289FD22E|nr:TRAP transporter small permease [Tianweitania sp.]